MYRRIYTGQYTQVLVSYSTPRVHEITFTQAPRLCRHSGYLHLPGVLPLEFIFRLVDNDCFYHTNEGLASYRQHLQVCWRNKSRERVTQKIMHMLWERVATKKATETSPVGILLGEAK